MKHVIKSVQVKGFTRTRKGRLERVKPFSREQKLQQRRREKTREHLTHLPDITLQNLLSGSSIDPDTKDFHSDVAAEIERRQKNLLENIRQRKEQVGEPFSFGSEKKKVADKWKNELGERLGVIKDKMQNKQQVTSKELTDLVTEIDNWRMFGEPYSVKEHSQDEYKKYLASLKGDEKELSLEQWKLRLALESIEPVGEPYSTLFPKKVKHTSPLDFEHFLAMEKKGPPKDKQKLKNWKWRQEQEKLGEPFVADKPLRHIELETKGMKKTKEWKIKEAVKANNNTEKPPKVLDAKFKKDINSELHDISSAYHVEFPSEQIFDILRKRGVVVLQEDGTEWSGFFLGASAQTFFQIAPVGSAEILGSKENPYTIYTPFKNTMLAMGWYKMPSGKYEMTTYVG
ncbi:hypothetical protein A2Z67_04560 [Candidatus Woesebacteria bacterium RBG_13_36_22]|uniref:Uncharacterized protein n=1 Tax=Candidatus Woesebacteria bacterium RBG_13_36_22 TaxID=1802478 RepID=A0A1F7X262_9BACT|nr:MAG: hypothetical protein A2Z67_04560 [Candidatus Woesebacteria bacterium RBG_13_36_22]